MQVNHNSDQVTHAVIGAKDAVEFGMSNSAEFFNILSDTLYSDKPLAVVREVLCNAWDIHIQCGIQDKPVQVTITQDEMKIRDFGCGISPEMMPEIYCTYGNSTKKNDGKQTGGFGLGSKSPFAYTDHFDVVSFHNHVKTIYKLSKTSAEVEGKPGLLEIMSIPSTESGLEVTIRFVKSTDHINFKQIVERIARNGAMNVELNGKNLPILPFDKMQHGWVLLPEDKLNDYTKTFFVRYGNVIYPIPPHERFKEYMTIVEAFLKQMPGSYWQLVLQAEPNTISVTPSRESLSLSSRTVDTLESLLSVFCRTFNALLEKEVYELVEQSREKLFSAMQFDELYSKTRNKIPGLTLINKSYGWKSEPIIDYKSIIEVYAKQVYPNFKGFAEKEFEDRIYSMINAGVIGHDTLKRFISDYRHEKRTNKYTNRGRYYDTNLSKYVSDGSDWFHRKILGPVYTELKAANLATHKLFVKDKEEDSHWKGESIFEAKKLEKRGIRHYFRYCRKIVILTYRVNDVNDRMANFPNIERIWGGTSQTLIYSVARSTKKVEQAKAVFEKLGYKIFDLTIAHPWEIPEAPDPLTPIVVATPAPKRLTGIPLMKDLLVNHNTDITASAEKWKDATRSETPMVVIRTRNNGDHITLAHMPSNLRAGIAERFSEVIGICLSTTQEDKYIKQGAVGFENFIYSKILDQFLTNPRIKAYFLIHSREFMRSAHEDPWYYNKVEEVFRLMSRDPVLSRTLGFHDPLTKSDMFWIELYQQIEQYQYRWDHNRLWRAVQGVVMGFVTDKTPVRNAIHKLATSSLLELVDVHSLIGMIQGPKGYLVKLKAKKFLITALKG